MKIRTVDWTGIEFDLSIGASAICVLQARGFGTGQIARRHIAVEVVGVRRELPHGLKSGVI